MTFPRNNKLKQEQMTLWGGPVIPCRCTVWAGGIGKETPVREHQNQDGEHLSREWSRSFIIGEPGEFVFIKINGNSIQILWPILQNTVGASKSISFTPCGKKSFLQWEQRLPRSLHVILHCATVSEVVTERQTLRHEVRLQGETQWGPAVYTAPVTSRHNSS